MIQSILDSDLYKFTMQQAVLELYPNATAEYRFINRRPKDKFSQPFLDQLLVELQQMSRLRLSRDEANWLAGACPFLKTWYIDYLRNYHFNPAEVSVGVVDGDLSISIAGPWHRTILWEVPLMALISEIYFKQFNWNHDGQEEKIIRKMNTLEKAKCQFADFGTRRRRSFETQMNVVKHLAARTRGFFVGTSNPYLAMFYKTKPIGTQAHEWVQAHSVLGSLLHANRDAMNAWVRVYNASLGIVLPDTYGLKSFLMDFDAFQARLWDGVRHDSGDPLDFAKTLVEHYKWLKIDPSTKTLVFSDSLTPERCCQIRQHCERLGIRCSFGIGTNFTNDFGGDPLPLNMVIKLWKLNGYPVVKLSDDMGKAMGERDAVRVARYVHFGTPLDD